MPPTDVPNVSLWTLIDSLQRRFEARGLTPAAVDSAVVLRLRSLLSANARNDEHRQRQAAARVPFGLLPSLCPEG